MLVQKSLVFLFILFAATSAFASEEFAPADYQFYDQTRSLEISSDVIARAKETRKQFSNERFVASTGVDNWTELTQLWSEEHSNPLWASEKVLAEGL